MGFTYTVPLTRMQGYLLQVHPSLRPAFVERMRFEIHSELTKRLSKPGTLKAPTGTLSASIETRVTGTGIEIHSPLDYAKIVEEGAKPFSMPPGKRLSIPGIGIRTVSWKSLREGKWRYPGSAGKRVFRDSVDAVLLRAHRIIRQLDAEAREIGL